MPREQKENKGHGLDRRTTSTDGSENARRMVQLISSITSTLRDLLRIARVAMPSDLYAIDPRIQNATELLSRLRQAEEGELPTSEWDVSAALDEFMRDPVAPSTRSEAIKLIVRDWLVGHGYLEPTPDRDEAN